MMPRAVELERVGDGAEGAQLGQGGQVVAHLAARPRHRVGALVDDRVEPRSHDGQEVAVTAAGEVDRPAPGGHDPVGCCHRVPAGQVEVAPYVVAGAGRDDPERYARAGECLHGEVDHAVATAHDERLDAVGHTPTGQVRRLVGVASLEVADHEPAVTQAVQRGVAVARALALPCGGVGQQRDLAPAPRRGRH